MSKLALRHLFDKHILITTGIRQTLCGKKDHPDEFDMLLGAGSGSYVKDFDEVVDEEPKEGFKYCRNCEKSWRRDNAT